MWGFISVDIAIAIIIVLLIVILSHSYNATLMEGGSEIILIEKRSMNRGSLPSARYCPSHITMASTFWITQVGIGIYRILCLCVTIRPVFKENIL